MTDPLLEVRDLQTTFRLGGGRRLKAVDGVSFTLRAGETLAIVGESGSGKSVTSLSIMGLLPAATGAVTGGQILLRGRDLTRLTDREMRQVRGKEIGMIFQEPMTSLNPVHTIGRQIAEIVLRHEGVGRARARERAVEMLALVGIPEPRKRADSYPHEMSGGMRQRAMIAMALACRPGVLIADEPTTALDVTIQAQILELMKDLQQQLGMGIVFITHDLGVVAEMADRVVVMYASQVVETGPVEEIFARPRMPYTAGLMASIPRLDPDAARGRLRTIPGQVPNLNDLPDGCRFAPRCEFAERRAAAPRCRRWSWPESGGGCAASAPPSSICPTGCRHDRAAAGGHRPGEDLPGPRRHPRPCPGRGAGGCRRQLRCRQGRGRGPRRRERIGQDHRRPDAAAARGADLRHRPLRRHRRHRAGAGGHAPVPQADADHLSGPLCEPEPAREDPHRDRPRAGAAPDRHRRRPRGADRRPAGPGGARRRLSRPIPARILRRSAAADRHRPRAGRQPRIRGGGRAGQRARRLDPGAGDQPSVRPARAARLLDAVHRARSVGGRTYQRPGDRDVSGPGDGDRAARASSTPGRATPTPGRCSRRCRCQSRGAAPSGSC